MDASSHGRKSLLLIMALAAVLGWIAYDKLLRPDFTAPSQAVGTAAAIRYD